MEIRVYADEGVGLRSLKQTIKSLEQVIPNNTYKIKTINHLGFLEETWESKTALVVFPGGRDVPYHAKLDGKANQRIKAFVEDGGAYLGICAGAYYGSGFVEFEKGCSLEVCERRHLAFFPGKAIGPAYGSNSFCYDSEKGAKIALIEWVGSYLPECYSLYYNGGCFFDSPDQFSNVNVLARYADLEARPAAAVQCCVGKGQAFLCGVHPEYQARYLKTDCLDKQELASFLVEKEIERKGFWLRLIRLALPQI